MGASVKASPHRYSRLSEISHPSEYNPVEYYSDVEEDLFNRIMMKYMSPGK